MSLPKTTPLKIKRASVTEHGFTYETFRLTGWINGARIRRQFKTREEAEGERDTLEVSGSNTAGPLIRRLSTRLSEAQVRTAETIFDLVPDPLAAVQWYKANYRSPIAEMPLEAARDAFIADRTPHISTVQLRDYKRTLRLFVAAFPTRAIHTINTAEVQAYLTGLRVGPKAFNNNRTNLNAFFAYSCHASRKWAAENPVAGVAKFKIARGLPEILTPEKCAELMVFLETYSGPEKCHGEKRKPGCLVPYFAICLFAGLRPDWRDGEILKLGESPDLEKLFSREMGVIRITPEISKVGAVRQVKIRPNLAAWLDRYPLKDYPIIVRNMKDMVRIVRQKFALSPDVLRHTYISAHVAKWKSMGEAALEAGNSEAMIRTHYLNMLTEAQAEAFWGIVPKQPAEAAEPSPANMVAFAA